MGITEDIYDELDADVSEEEFREAVARKVEQMDGLLDEESAAQLVAHEVGESEVTGIDDVEAGMDEVKFLGKVTSVGELRTFERDDGEGQVVNVEVADETGRVRVALWDEQATAAAEELEPGQVLRIAGRPKEGYNGIEVSATRIEADEDADIDVQVGEFDEFKTIDSLSNGLSDVTLHGLVLDTEPVRTFSRDDGSEGRVANLALGDETGRVRVTLWDEQADRAEEIEAGTSVEIIDGYVRERDGSLELHVGSRSVVEEIDEQVEYTPDATPIAELELGQTADIAGVIRSADPKRTFDRDDGSEGQVRNVRVQDHTGDIRVALWSEKADLDLGPGDEVLVADAEIKEGWQEDLEASAGWQTTVTVLDDAAVTMPAQTPDSVSGSDAEGAGDADGGTAGTAGTGGAATDTGDKAQATGLSAFADGAEASATSSADADASDGTHDDTDEVVTFTGTVVQPGDPVILDNDEETMKVHTDHEVRLGQEVTVRGRLVEGHLDAEDVF